MVVDENEASAEPVDVGSRVEIEDERGERMEVEISSVGGVSPDSPVGRASSAARVGDEVEIEAPRGKWRARVLSQSRLGQSQSEQRRREQDDGERHRAKAPRAGERASRR